MPNGHARKSEKERSRVLLVGWRDASAIALERAGVRVDCLVSTADHGRATQSGHVEQIVSVDDVNDIEEALAGLARGGVALEDFDVMCSGSEFSLVTASVLGALGGVRAMPVASSMKLRDKFLQKEAIRAAGIPTADCWVLGPGDAIDSPFPESGVVIKPLSGAGAANTRRFTSLDEFRIARMNDTARHVLVESYVSGWEVQIDGVVRDGTVEELIVSRYLQNLIEVHAGGLVGAIALHPRDHDALYSNARALVVAALAALGHRDGVFHLEAFVGDGGLVFGECAGRVSGGMSDRVIQRMFGVDLHGEWACAALDSPRPGRDREEVEQSFGDVYLVASPGIVRSVPTEDEILARPGVVDVRLDLREGAESSTRNATHVRAATVLVEGSNAERVEDVMRETAAWFTAACAVEQSTVPLSR